MTGTLTGRGVLFWLLGFFGVIMAMNACYITMSIRTFRGEDEQLPYLQGITYNRLLARRAEQNSLGWRAEVSAARLSTSKVRLHLEVRDREGRPVRGLKLAGTLRHPADENRDRPLAIRPVSAGVYEAEVLGAAPGAWDVVVRAAGRPFEMESRLWLP
jgi:nitrogen fixation protein FixH